MSMARSQPLHSNPVRYPFVRLLLSVVAFHLITSSLVTAQTPTAAEDDVVRVDADVTNLFFTVTDKQKKFVTTLRENDVQVLEDGSPQQILVFQRETDRPVSLAFLIDVSASEAKALSQLKGAARSFIESVIRSKDDEAALIPFTDRAFLEQPFTGNLINLYHVLSQIEVALPLYFGIGQPISGLPTGPGISIPAQGTTALWDAVAVTASEVMGPRPGTRRRAIILLTDGRDTSSRVKRDVAIERAIASETVVYAIGIGDESLEGVDKSPLQKLAEATGGRAFFPKKDVDLKNAFNEIETELRSQYLIAYTSSNKNRDGSFRQMRIEVTNPEIRAMQLKLRHRPGYYAKRLATSTRTQEK